MSGSATALQVRITAKDDASAALARIGLNAKAVGSQFSKLGDQFRSIGSSGFGRVAQQVRETSRSFERLVPAMGAVTGAASVAGVIGATGAWAKYGAEMRRSAYRTQTSVSEMTKMRAAAQLLGVSAEDVTSGMKGLGDAMVDAAGGRDQEALQYFEQLGVNYRGFANGTVTARQALDQVLNSLQKVSNPSLKARVLSVFRMPETIVPLTEKGAAGFRKLEKEAASYGVVMQDNGVAAEKFAQEQTRLGWAFTGLGNSIFQTVSPALAGLMRQFADFIGLNRLTWAKAIKTGFTWITDAVKDGYKKFKDWIDDGGWDQMKTSLSELGTSFTSISTAVGDVGKAVSEGLPGLRSFLAEIQGILDTYNRWEKKFEEFQRGPVMRFLFPDLAVNKTKEQQEQEGAPKGRVWSAGDAVGEAMIKLQRQFEAVFITRVPADQRLGGYPSGAALRGANDLPGADTSGAGSTPGQLEPEIEKKIRDAAAKHGVDPDFAVRIARIEGGRAGGRDLISPAGAIGTMQLMPGTARDLGVNPNNVDQNIDGGVRYLKQLLAKFNGDYRAAAAAYNAGPNSGAVAGFAATGDASKLPAETQGYIRRLDRLTSQGGSGGYVHGRDADRPIGKPQQTSQKVPVEVTVRLAGNFPAGTTATARTPDGTRVARAMDGGMG